MNRGMFIVYDERALSMSTDDAQVMVACGSKKEAKEYRDSFPGCPVYSYETAEDGKTLINERYEFTL
jgi:hypothetical protein